MGIPIRWLILWVDVCGSYTHRVLLFCKIGSKIFTESSNPQSDLLIFHTKWYGSFQVHPINTTLAFVFFFVVFTITHKMFNYFIPLVKVSLKIDPQSLNRTFWRLYWLKLQRDNSQQLSLHAKSSVGYSAHFQFVSNFTKTFLTGLKISFPAFHGIQNYWSNRLIDITYMLQKMPQKVICNVRICSITNTEPFMQISRLLTFYESLE